MQLFKISMVAGGNDFSHPLAQAKLASCSVATNEKKTFRRIDKSAIK